MKKSEIKEIIKEELHKILLEISTVNAGLSDQRLNSTEIGSEFDPSYGSENIMNSDISSVLDSAMDFNSDNDDDTFRIRDKHPKPSLSFLYGGSKNYRDKNNSANQSLSRHGFQILKYLDNEKE